MESGVENQEKVAEGQRGAAAVGAFNLYASPPSAEMEARRERVARNRRRPDNRRRAFLQELAVAVADELELRAAVDERRAQEQQLADEAQDAASEAAAEAAFAAKHPLAAAYGDAKGRSVRRAPFGQKMLDASILKWAIATGILSHHATEIPDTETQYLALAQHKLTESH